MPLVLVGTCSGAAAVPISVCTQPGCSASTVMREGGAEVEAEAEAEAEAEVEFAEVEGDGEGVAFACSLYSRA